MHPRSRRDVWLVLVCLLISAIWIALGPIHRHHTADSIVMALVSLYRWTPLYWEQDRLGMFFPLLATPWREPLDNLLVQALRSHTGAQIAFSNGWRYGAPVIPGPVTVTICTTWRR